MRVLKRYKNLTVSVKDCPDMGLNRIVSCSACHNTKFKGIVYQPNVEYSQVKLDTTCMVCGKEDTFKMAEYPEPSRLDLQGEEEP